MKEFFSELKQKIVFDFSKKETVSNRVKEIAGYVHNLFEHDGATIPKSLSPFDIVEAAKNGASMRCVEYSFLLAALLWAYDIPARVVGLKKKTMETDTEAAGHVVVEFWDRDHNKWVMCDPQAGVIPFANLTPLSAYELDQEIVRGAIISYEKVLNARFYDEHSIDYTNWVKDYLFYFDTAIDQNYLITNEERLVERKLMLIPEDVPEPKIFQGKFPINAVYTKSANDFYKRPDIVHTSAW